MVRRMFQRTIGIDYSGTAMPVSMLNGLAVCCADGDGPPQTVAPPRNAANWSRKEIAQWLVRQLGEGCKPTLVGIDHAFSFPIQYFQKYDLPLRDWDHFLDDFQAYWPTGEDRALVQEIRFGSGQGRCGEDDWLRLTDQLTGTAKSVFRFNVQGSVAHSTHAGLPWLRYVRRELGDRVHFWPFDGWDIPEGRSVIAEVYPALWKWRFERAAGLNDHQHDAYSVAGWMSYADRNGSLAGYFNPELSPEERTQADAEGWILGVLGYIRLGQP